MNELPPQAHMMNLITGKMVTQAIATAVELGIPDLLKDATKTSDELATRTGANADGVYRLMRALSLVGVVTETEGKTFALTAVGACLRTDVPGSLSGMAKWIGADFHTELWFDLTHCVKTGEHAIKKRHGYDNGFDYFQKNPKALSVFQGAMTSFSSVVAEALVEGYDFSPFRKVADVGGGHGLTLRAILSKNPSASGVLFDLPDVAAGAKAVLGDLAARCEVTGGDFFKAVPAGCDAYVFKHIVHDWSDDKCIAFLKNTAQAMAPNAKVLVVEHVIPAPGVPSFGKMLDLEMLVVTPGGRERTESEFATLFAKAGLKLSRVVPLRTPVSVVEAVRA